MEGHHNATPGPSRRYNYPVKASGHRRGPVPGVTNIDSSSDGSLSPGLFASRNASSRNVARLISRRGSDRSRSASRDSEGSRPGSRQNRSVMMAKRASGSRSVEAASPAPRSNDGSHRSSMRKSASTGPPRRPQSTFTYVAPLLGRPLSAKSGDPRPSFIIAEERRAKEARKQVLGEYDLGLTRNSPRISLPSMSVQRRAVPSPRKASMRNAAVSPIRRKMAATNFAKEAQGPPQATVHVGRGGSLVYGSDESDGETSASSTSSSSQHRPQLGRKSIRGQKAARKTKTYNVLRQRSLSPERMTESSGTDIMTITKGAKKLNVTSRNNEGSLGLLRPGKRARKIQAVPAPEKEVIIISDSSESGLEELREAFDSLFLATHRLQQHNSLPFLRRNLERGFELWCRRFGIEVAPPDPPEHAIKVVYKYYLDESGSDASVPGGESGSDGGREHQMFVGSMPDWRCPICELFRPFKTKQMLDGHMDRDHSRVKVTWQKYSVRNQQRWSMVLVIPDIEEEGEDSQLMRPPIEGEGEDSESDPGEGPRSKLKPRHDPRLPGNEADEPSSLESSTSPSFSVEELEEKKPILLSALGRMQTHRSSLTTSTRTSYRGSLPPRYPSPPPPSDRLGPAAQPPYLPETDADGNELYSCRIGGPRLFDLLNTLPMEEFGIMSWAVIDIEEKLFEMEDMRDEDKVMHALWNRWITVNRVEFLFNDYFEGVKKFIDRYWPMIHQAAGWRALRTFLLMLSVNKYLTFDKVLQSLRYYQELVGMKFWYQDDPPPEPMTED